jgi:hypothetical protein
VVRKTDGGADDHLARVTGATRAGDRSFHEPSHAALRVAISRQRSRRGLLLTFAFVGWPTMARRAWVCPRLGRGVAGTWRTAHPGRGGPRRGRPVTARRASPLASRGRRNDNCPKPDRDSPGRDGDAGSTVAGVERDAESWDWGHAGPRACGGCRVTCARLRVPRWPRSSSWQSCTYLRAFLAPTRYATSVLRSQRVRSTARWALTAQASRR